MRNDSLLELLKTSDVIVQPQAAWETCVGPDGLQRLAAAGFLIPLSPTELDGRTEMLDLGDGEVEYHLEVRADKIMASPVDLVGAIREFQAEQLKIFRLERRILLELIAKKNSFIFNEGLPRFVDNCVLVGTRDFEGRKIHLLALFEESDLCLPGFAASLRELEAKALAVIIMMASQPGNIPSI